MLRSQDADDSYRSWGIEQSIELAKRLKAIGVDLIDVSSGGLLKQQKIDVKPSYQSVLSRKASTYIVRVPFAEALKREKELDGLLIGSVGLLTDGKQCEEIVRRAGPVRAEGAAAKGPGRRRAARARDAPPRRLCLRRRTAARHCRYVGACAYRAERAVNVPVQYQRALCDRVVDSADRRSTRMYKK